VSADAFTWLTAGDLFGVTVRGWAVEVVVSLVDVCGAALAMGAIVFALASIAGSGTP
jgi:hypothetical protein